MQTFAITLQLQQKQITAPPWPFHTSLCFISTSFLLLACACPWLHSITPPGSLHFPCCSLPSFPHLLVLCHPIVQVAFIFFFPLLLPFLSVFFLSFHSLMVFLMPSPCLSFIAQLHCLLYYLPLSPNIFWYISPICRAQNFVPLKAPESTKG